MFVRIFVKSMNAVQCRNIKVFFPDRNPKGMQKWLVIDYTFLLWQIIHFELSQDKAHAKRYRNLALKTRSERLIWKESSELHGGYKS